MITGQQLMQRHNATLGPDDWPLVSAYTRADAIADGEQIRIDEMTDANGKRFCPCRWPVFMTRGAWGAVVQGGAS